MSVHSCRVNVLCQQIGGIGGAWSFRQGEIVGLQVLLSPQVSHRQMPDVAQLSPSANADSGSRIGQNVEGKDEPQVCCQ